MVLSIYKEETIRMKGLCYLGNHICFGKYERLEPVWIRSMSSYKKQKKWRIQVGDDFENDSDSFQSKEFQKYIQKYINDTNRINAFLEKQISDLKDLIEELVEDGVIPSYSKTRALPCILLFLDFFLQDYMKVKNGLSSERRKEAKKEAERQAQSHPEKEFLYYMKIPFFQLKNMEHSDENAKTNFRNSVQMLFSSLKNNPDRNRFVDSQISGLTLDRCLVESGLQDLIDYILRDSIDIDIFLEDDNFAKYYNFDEASTWREFLEFLRDGLFQYFDIYFDIFLEDDNSDEYSNSDKASNCPEFLRDSLFQFVDDFLQDFRKLKNLLLSEKEKYDKDEKKGNDWSDYEI